MFKRSTSILLLLILVVPVFLSACSVSVVRGSGKVITETRQVSGFNALSFSGMGDIAITQGESESLTIEAEDNILARISTEVRNNTLYIRYNNLVPGDWIQPTKPIKFNLTVKSLSDIDLSGAGNIHTTSLKAETLDIAVSGAGDIKFDYFEGSQLNVHMSGAGNVNISGKVDTQTVEISGLGNFHADVLESTRTTINVSGAGGATVWVKETLNVQISGAGTINYYGNPSVNKAISGVGVVKSLGNK